MAESTLSGSKYDILGGWSALRKLSTGFWELKDCVSSGWSATWKLCWGIRELQQELH
jgi:hypothetical protein